MIQWQDHCHDWASGQLQHWAQDTGSTCEKLKQAQCGALEVALCEVQPCLAVPFATSDTPGWLRTVQLNVCQQPWMWAQAWLTDQPCHQHLMVKFKQPQPLGAWLFSAAYQLQRSVFQYASGLSVAPVLGAVDGRAPLLARKSFFLSFFIGGMFEKSGWFFMGASRSFQE